MRRNKPNLSTWIFALPIILALTSIGCGLSSVLNRSEATPEGRLRRTPLPTFTPTQVGAAFVDIPTALPSPTVVETQEPVAEVPEPVVIETEEPVPTPEPTATTPPVEEEVTVTIVQNMNIRTGPGTNYSIAGPGPAGETSPVVGRNADGSWLQVEYPLTADGTGWVFTELVEVSGNPETVEVVNVDPPAVAAAQPAQQVQQEEEASAPADPSYQFTPTGWHASENAAIVQFKGRIRDEGGNLVNGFSVLVDNQAFSVLAHPTGGSRWYPDKGDGEWDVVMPNIFDAQGWWWLTVVTYDCAGFFDAGFDSQCKQFTRLSEDVKIEVRTPEESIINADWVCHWDCNQGLYVEGYHTGG